MGAFFMPIQTLSVGAAFEKVAGYRPHPTTSWRYAAKGVRGVVLRTIMVGGRRLTTEEWVADFIERRTLQTTPEIDQSAVRKQLDRELGVCK